jgi:hypothetical protein
MKENQLLTRVMELRDRYRSNRVLQQAHSATPCRSRHFGLVHTHSPDVVPFTVSQAPLRAIYHDAAFLAAGAPVWNIRRDFGATDMLVRNPHWPIPGANPRQQIGGPDARPWRCDGRPIGQGRVFRAYYTDINARLQSQALALGGEVNYLTPEEGAKADSVNLIVLDRIWACGRCASRSRWRSSPVNRAPLDYSAATLLRSLRAQIALHQRSAAGAETARSCRP